MDGHASAGSGPLATLCLSFLLLTLFVWAAPVSAADDEEDEYDHETTSIPTEGAHSKLGCEACHVDEEYDDIPMQCQGCHDGGIALGKPTGHMSTSENCDACHNTISFRIPQGSTRATEFDHELTGFPLQGAHRALVCSDCHRNQVFRGTPSRCMVCHDGISAPGKPLNHVPSNLDCSECHSVWTFSVARFDHFAATAPCFTCHNGTTAPGKPPNHIVSSNQCDACHRTSDWSPDKRKKHH